MTIFAMLRLWQCLQRVRRQRARKPPYFIP